MNMPKFMAKRWHGMHTAWALLAVLLLSVVLMAFYWPLGVAGLAICGLLCYYTFTAERSFHRNLTGYIESLSYRVKRAGADVLAELPIGVVLYSEDKTVEWHNPFVGDMLQNDSVIGASLEEWFPALPAKDHPETVEIKGRIFRVQHDPEERLLYFTDVTEQIELTNRYEGDKLVLGIVMMDNLDEATAGMDDQSRQSMLNRASGEITEWARRYGIFLKRLSTDRYMLVLNQRILMQLEQSRFDILDEVRESTLDQKLPITLSIGIAAGSESLIELGHLAQTSLDIALGRGGDQVAVKTDGRLTFYGGKTNAVEKRTRVRARVISHALRDLILESDRVVIMGHRYPDMDSVGAAVGLLRAARLFHKEAYIVMEGIHSPIEKLMEFIQEDEELFRRFIGREQAVQMTTSNTLAIVVDTHKRTMVEEPRLLKQTSRIVIVDHHRRGEEFMKEAVLVYLEPYASSTCELVTELLQYIHDRVPLQMVEATALLAGITVDTKNFTLRTGARTFDAASFLRRCGADPSLIQSMLKEKLDEYIQKAELIKHTEVMFGHIAVAVSDQTCPQLLIAKAADALLNMTDIVASFVVCRRPDGLVGISARSLGHMNVQVVMERLGGGGHFNNAAAQLEGSVEEAGDKLKQILTQMEAEEGLFE